MCRPALVVLLGLLATLVSHSFAVSSCYVPRRFASLVPRGSPLSGGGGGVDESVSLRLWKASCAWRDEADVTSVYCHPSSSTSVLFDAIKRFSPHSFVSYDAAGNVVVLHRPGDLDLQRLKSLGISKEDLLRHYIFMMEYCLNVLDFASTRPINSASQQQQQQPKRHHPQGTGFMTTVVDASGMSFSKVSRPDSLSFFRSFAQIMSDNYPDRNSRLIMVNCPLWLERLFNLVFGRLMQKEARDRFLIFGSVDKPCDRRAAAEADLGIDLKELLNHARAEADTNMDKAMREYAIRSSASTNT